MENTKDIGSVNYVKQEVKMKTYYYKNKNNKIITCSCNEEIKPSRKMVVNGEDFLLVKKDIKIKIGKLEIVWKRY
jgi:hypothetical protein